MKVLGQRVHGMLLGTEGAEHAVEPGIAWDTPAVLQTSKATLYTWKCSGVAVSCLRRNQGRYAQERHLNSLSLWPCPF